MVKFVNDFVGYVSSDLHISQSMEIMAKPTSRSCDIVLRRYVLISFNFEKVLSQWRDFDRQRHQLTGLDIGQAKNVYGCSLSSQEQTDHEVFCETQTQCYFAFQIECTNIFCWTVCQIGTAWTVKTMFPRQWILSWMQRHREIQSLTWKSFSGVTRVGVTQGGNWGCPPIFSWINRRPFLLITVTFIGFTRVSPPPLEGVTPVPFLPDRPRLSTVLCKFTHNFFSLGCHPSGGCHPGWSAPP